MEFGFILQFIKALFECIEDRRREEVEAGLNNPGRREYRVILRTLRKESDLHGRELFAEADEVFSALLEMDAEDVAVLMDKAEQKASAQDARPPSVKVQAIREEF